jgi:hypothetical protein
MKGQAHNKGEDSFRLPPHEFRYNEAAGVIGIHLDDKTDFNKLSAEIAGFDTSRFEAIALKVYITNQPVVTIYAIDLERRKRHPESAKIPVHKFKKEMTLDDLFFHLKHVNFTVTSGDIDIEDMEVINK